MKYNIYRLFFLLVFINCIFISLAIFSYGQPFLFWQYPLSHLGATLTENGFNNMRAAYLFISDMLVSSIIMLIITYFFWQNKNIRYYAFKFYLSLFSGIGFILAAFPCNLYDPIHIAGSAITITSFWLLIIIFLQEIKKYFYYAYILLHLLLHSTLIAYALTFILNFPSKQLFQKLAVLGLFLALMISLRIMSVIRKKHRNITI